MGRKQFARWREVEVLQRTKIRHAAFEVVAVSEKKIRLPELAAPECPEQICCKPALAISNAQLGDRIFLLDLVHVVPVAEDKVTAGMKNVRTCDGHERARHRSGFLRNCDSRMAPRAGSVACEFLQARGLSSGPPTRFGEVVVSGELRAHRGSGKRPKNNCED